MIKFENPSRPDAWLLTRSEKTAMLFIMNTVSALQDCQIDLEDRLNKIPDGVARMADVADKALALLDEIRATIPTKQRMNLNNTAMDYEMRLAPKMTPGKTNVIVQKEEFRTLVDAAQRQCVDCIMDCEECKQCKLYELLTAILPMERYENLNLCPYNMAKWEN